MGASRRSRRQKARQEHALWKNVTNELETLQDAGYIQNLQSKPLGERWVFTFALDESLVFFPYPDSKQAVKVTSQSYQVAFWAPGKSNEAKVFILAPHIHPKAPHLHADRSLCLFHAKNVNWKKETSLSETYFGWTLGWIYFYEKWLETGEWLGPEAGH